ncbi:MAG: hypothetical protein R3F11_30120 [Verrucomicrobiales bacterium]
MHGTPYLDLKGERRRHRHPRRRLEASARRLPPIPLPANNCDEANPFLAVPCYVSGDPLAAGADMADDHVLVVFPYAATGDVNAGGTALHRFANAGQIGSTWGLASHAATGRIFSAAVLKRHVGLGPNGLGAIYVSDLSTGDAATTPMATAKLVDFVADLGIDVGHAAVGGGLDLSDAAASNAACGFANEKRDPSLDADVFDDIGEVGFRDLDINEAGTHLYVVNSLRQDDLPGRPGTNPTVPGVLPDPRRRRRAGHDRPPVGHRDRGGQALRRRGLHRGKPGDLRLGEHRDDVGGGLSARSRHRRLGGGTRAEHGAGLPKGDGLQ